MLETFWQIRLFEQIIRRANLRLMQMTDGRYELRRQKNSTDGRGKSGLELDIVDHWNGSVRNVCTLSGGESFAASLALALALSDETEAESVDDAMLEELCPTCHHSSCTCRWYIASQRIHALW
jgi:exonuclease SbcC